MSSRKTESGNVATVAHSRLGEEVKNEIVVYQPDTALRLDVRLENETVWLSQDQMCQLFQRDQSVVARHIKNAFSEGEVDEPNNMQILHKIHRGRPVVLYSLDVIISVGYRVKSVRQRRNDANTERYAA